MHMCDALPAPTVATDALSGLALSQSISSFRSFAGRSFFPRIHNGDYGISGRASGISPA